MARNLLSYLITVLLAVLMFNSQSLSAQNIINCYPASSDYWTGSTTSTAKTQTAIIYTIANGSRGWMKFDISAIPDGAIISNVQLNYNIMNSYYPYYRFTKLNADPVTTAAPNLYALIGQATTNSSSNTYFSYASTQQSGQVSATLNSYAINDLEASLTQNWFAVGLYEYDPNTYYMQVSGWNTTARPYLTITYTPAVMNDIGIKSIISPVSQIIPGNYPIQILLKNYGLNMISSALINWSLNGITMPQIAFNDTISPGNTRLVTLASSTNFPPGIHVINVTAIMPNNVQDPNPTNNTKILTINAAIPPIAFDIDTAAVCPGSSVVLPIMTWNFNHISSLSLKALYNGNALQYTGYQDLHQGISNFGITTSSGTNSSLTMTASTSGAMNIPPDDTLVELVFTYLGGNGSLNWDTTSGACIVYDTVNNIVPMYLYNGQVSTLGPTIYTQPPSTLNVPVGSTASIYVGAYGGSITTYQWQISTSGGSVWTNLTNSNNFSGVTTHNLTITGITTYFQGVKFRCIISALCSPVTSNVTTLQLINSPVYCLLDSLTICTLNNLDLKVRVHNFGNVAAFSLKLLYNSSNLTYLNWSGLNANLPSSNSFSVIPSGDTLMLTWNWTLASGFDTGVLVHLHFNANGPISGTTLSWINDNTISSFFHGTNGLALNAHFFNGWINANQPPAAPGQITGPILVCPGVSNILYTIPSGSNINFYQWTLPAGATIVSGGNSNIIIVNFGSTFTGGYLTVKGSNNCGYSPASVLLINVCNTQPDSIQCILPDATVCQGIIHYPVLINNATGLASISLGIIFENQQLSYQGYSNPFPGLSTGFLAVNASINKIQIGWFSVTPVNMDQDTLLCLDLIADTGWSALYFDLQTPGTCYLTDINSATLNASYISGSVFAGGCSEVIGNISYDNTLSSPINNTLINLNLNGSQYNSTLSDASGNYTFTGIQNGAYQLGANITKVPGGINATDALKVLNHFVNTNPLTGLKLLAADVDGTGFINASDGLMIVKRFVGLITTFPVGNWLVVQQPLNVAGAQTITVDLKAICYGDIDGSFVPAIKENPAIDVSGNGKVIQQNNNHISIPLISTQNAFLGAVSLILTIEEDGFVLETIDCPFNGNLIFHQQDNEIRIGWYSLKPMNVETGENIMTLNFNYSGDKVLSSLSDLHITAIGESNASTPLAETLDQFNLNYPSRFAPEGEYLTVSPNPAKDEVRVEFYLNKTNSYKLKLLNSQGQKLIETSASQPAEGFHSLSLDLSPFTSELYMLVLESDAGLQRVKILKN